MMNIQRFSLSVLADALRSGWQVSRATRMISALYTLPFALFGLLILLVLHSFGFLPFMAAAAGSFMLFGPVLLAGFSGIARAHEAGQRPGWRAVFDGYCSTAPAFWILALVCLLLFLIFVTDAAILYSYMMGRTPFSFAYLLDRSEETLQFLTWAGVSGAVVAAMVYAVTAFSMSLLCERRVSLVTAVATSIRAVFKSPLAALGWALLLGVFGIGSVILLPLLPVVLPWLAYSGRYLLYQVVLSDGE